MVARTCFYLKLNCQCVQRRHIGTETLASIQTPSSPSPITALKLIMSLTADLQATAPCRAQQNRRRPCRARLLFEEFLLTGSKAKRGGLSAILKASGDPHSRCPVAACHGTFYDAAKLIIASLELKNSKREERTCVFLCVYRGQSAPCSQPAWSEAVPRRSGRTHPSAVPGTAMDRGRSFRFMQYLEGNCVTSGGIIGSREDIVGPARSPR